jgi:hypothetical protein
MIVIDHPINYTNKEINEEIQFFLHSAQNIDGLRKGFFLYTVAITKT